MSRENKTSWHVVYTKPRSEKKVEERLLKNGIEVYCPTYTTLKQWSDRKKKVELPLLPSYVFINMEERMRLEVLQDPGILNFVFWQGKPALISQIEIDTLKTELLRYETLDGEIGDEIIIEHGVFQGMEGVIIDKSKNQTSIYLSSLGMVLKFKN